MPRRIDSGLYSTVVVCSEIHIFSPTQFFHNMKKALLVMLTFSIPLFFASCEVQSCCGSKKNKKDANTTSADACTKCGKTSCDKSCSANETSSINGISDNLCTSKTTAQIEVEANVFKKMDAFKKISSVKELETGYEFVYENPNAELKLELIDFLKLEIKCCPSYDYALIVDAKTNTIHYQRFRSEIIKQELKAYLQMIDLIK